MDWVPVGAAVLVATNVAIATKVLKDNVTADTSTEERQRDEPDADAKHDN